MLPFASRVYVGERKHLAGGQHSPGQNQLSCYSAIIVLSLLINIHFIHNNEMAEGIPNLILKEDSRAIKVKDWNLRRETHRDSSDERS